MNAIFITCTSKSCVPAWTCLVLNYAMQQVQGYMVALELKVSICSNFRLLLSCEGRKGGGMGGEKGKVLCRPKAPRSQYSKTLRELWKVM